MPELPFITYDKYIRELDDALIISFRAFTPEDQKRLYAKILAANDKAYFAEAVFYNGRILFKIENYSIDIANAEVSFTLPAGRVYLELTEEVLEALKTVKAANVYVDAQISRIEKTRRGKTKIYIDDVIMKVADLNITYARELLKEYEPLDLICYALGYRPQPEIKALIIPRILPIFKPFNLGTHVIQFTPPETGKTTTIRLLSEFINGYHALSFPSRAKLIGDARFNSYGLCYKYDVIFVEEFDKIRGKRVDEFKEDYEALLTGLEQGVWQREKSSKSDISYSNPVSFFIAGNSENADLTEYGITAYAEDNRRKIQNIIEELTDVNAEPFISRFTYVEIITEPIKAMAYVNYNENNKPRYLPPAISRGIISILNERLKREKYRRETNRIVRHFNTLRNVLETLNIYFDENTLDNLVIGATTFLNAIKSGDIKADESEKPENIKFEEITVTEDD